MKSNLQKAKIYHARALRLADEGFFYDAFEAAWYSVANSICHIYVQKGLEKPSFETPMKGSFSESINSVLPEMIPKMAGFNNFQNTISLFGGCWNETAYEEQDEVRELIKVASELLALISYNEERRYGNVVIHERSGIFPINEILDLIEKDKKLIIDEHEVRVGEDRLLCFKYKGTICQNCGQKALYFALERVTSTNYDGWTLSLCGENYSYFTKDHIIPKSKGGPDILENYQTYCWDCNLRKGSQLSHEIRTMYCVTR